MKFPSSEVAFYLDKSKLPSRLAKNIIAISEPIHPAEIQERIDRVVGPTFVDSYFLHLAASVSNLILFWRYYLRT